MYLFRKNIVFLLIGISQLLSQIDTMVTIDASNYYDWTYFSIEEGSVVDIPNPESSLDWDFAIQRKHIKTNGGLSGIGNGGAFVDSSITWIEEWDNIHDLPNNVFLEADTLLNDFYNPITHMFDEGIKNPALNSWGWFDENYQLNVTHYSLFILAANGQDVIKFWPYNYYNQNGQGGNISIRYQTGLVYECSSLYGDMNDDLIVNVVDVIGLVNQIIFGYSLENSLLTCYDLNQDQIINVIDIIVLVDIILQGT